MKMQPSQCGRGTLTCEELFQGLPPEVLNTFESMLLDQWYPEGRALFLQGAIPGGIFLVREGKVRLLLSSVGADPVTLRIAGPGEFLGVGAAFNGTPYEATALAIMPVRAGVIGGQDFLKVLHDHPEVCFRASQLLSYELAAALDQLHGLERVRKSRR